MIENLDALKRRDRGEGKDVMMRMRNDKRSDFIFHC